MCGRVLNVTQAEVVSNKPVGSSVSFSLATLMVLITLVAVGLGLFAIAPGLGVLYCIALVPALVRTAVGVRKRVVTGQPLPFESKFQLFATSLAVSVAAFVAATVAFFATCFSSCLVYAQVAKKVGGNANTLFPLIPPLITVVSVAMAFVAFAAVFYRFRTSRKKRDFWGRGKR
jgi:hypothetical protein